MRSLSFISFLVFCFACFDTKKTSNLNGIWIPVKQEFIGVAMPDSTFKGQKLIISDSICIFMAQRNDKGILILKDGKMDIYLKEGLNSGKQIKAIYKYEDKKLTICYNLESSSYPQKFETKGEPGFFLSVYRIN